jgi:hypothetical protein
MSRRIQRLISQINTNITLLNQQYDKKELNYRINYDSNPQETDRYRYKLEQRTAMLNRKVNLLKS